MFQRLKNRWNIQSNVQIVIILIVFALTGSASVWIKKQIFDFIGIDDSLHYFFRLLLSILIITPLYQALLLVIAALFGQFRFFWEFEKKTFSRFRRNNKPTTK